MTFDEWWEQTTIALRQKVSRFDARVGWDAGAAAERERILGELRSMRDQAEAVDSMHLLAIIIYLTEAIRRAEASPDR